MGGFVFCLEPVPEKRWIFPGNRIFQCPSFDGRSFAAGGRVCNADSLLSPFFGGEFGSLRFQKERCNRVFLRWDWSGRLRLRDVFRRFLAAVAAAAVVGAVDRVRRAANR